MLSLYYVYRNLSQKCCQFNLVAKLFFMACLNLVAIWLPEGSGWLLPLKTRHQWYSGLQICLEVYDIFCSFRLIIRQALIWRHQMWALLKTSPVLFYSHTSRMCCIFQLPTTRIKAKPLTKPKRCFHFFIISTTTGKIVLQTIIHNQKHFNGGLTNQQTYSFFFFLKKLCKRHLCPVEGFHAESVSTHSEQSSSQRWSYKTSPLMS